MIIALASPRVASSLEDGLENVRHHLLEAARQGAQIVCFPEAYLPGLRGLDFEVPPFDQTDQDQVLSLVGGWAQELGIAVVLGMEWHTDVGRHIAAPLFDRTGTFLGVQTKNQLDPTEEPLYVPGHGRQVFEIDGLRFGVAICHEGFRYPETVRWAASQGAQVVFHPHCTGSDYDGPTLTRWGSTEGPYYEKAMMCRGLENTIYFASVNYAFRYQESATTLIDPSGACIAHLPYGEEGVLIADIDLGAATGLLASRYAPERNI
jgi:predicted amidohydrolase